MDIYYDRTNVTCDDVEALRTWKHPEDPVVIRLICDKQVGWDQSMYYAHSVTRLMSNTRPPTWTDETMITFLRAQFSTSESSIEFKLITVLVHDDDTLSYDLSEVLTAATII